MNKTDLPMISFKSHRDWASWLDKNHAKSRGIWLRLFKKDPRVASVTNAKALKKPETRARRIQAIPAMLKRGKKLHE